MVAGTTWRDQVRVFDGERTREIMFQLVDALPQWIAQALEKES